MKIKKIFEAFPPPKFLDIPFSGLSINDNAIRVIQFGRRHGNYYILKYSEKELQPGIVNLGEVVNKQELINILESLRKELNLNYVKISIPEEKAYLFTAKIPLVSEKQVQSEVQIKIVENVPVPSGELIFDYKIIDSTQKDFLRIVVSNLPISVVDAYVEIITGAGLTPISLEIESQAIVSSLIPNNDGATILVINFSNNKAGLYIANNRVVNFTSTIQMKGDLESDLDQLSHEVKKLYDYWHTLKDNLNKPEKKIQEIIICGENIPDALVPYLSTHHNTKVSLANVWINSFDINENVPVIDFTSSLRYPAAIGLALPTNTLI